MNEFLFLTAYGLYLAVAILKSTFYAVYIQGVSNPALVAGLGLLVLKEFSGTKYSFKTVTGAFVAFGLIIVINNFSSGMLLFGTSIVLIYCARNIPLDKILKLTVWLSGILFVFTVISAYAGVIMNYVNDSLLRRRCYMGFRYSLFGPAFLFNIIACDIYLLKDRIPNWKLLFYAVVDCICYNQTKSRLTFILTLFIIAAALVLKYKPLLLKKKALGILMANSYWICAGFSMWMFAKFGSGAEWIIDLDTLVEHRISLGVASLEKYGFSLLGNPEISWVGSGLDIYGNKNPGAYLYVDNLYLNMLQRYGIIFFVAFLVIFTLTCYKYLKRKDYYMLLILSVLAVHGIIDDLIKALYYNAFLIVAGVALLETVRSVVSVRAKKSAGVPMEGNTSA